MNRLEKILDQIQCALEDEKGLARKLDELKAVTASIEQEQNLERAQIALIQSETVRAGLEKSRRLWQRLAAVLAISTATFLFLAGLLIIAEWTRG